MGSRSGLLKFQLVQGELLKGDVLLGASFELV